jgi:hypothetical protein
LPKITSIYDAGQATQNTETKDDSFHPCAPAFVRQDGSSNLHAGNFATGSTVCVLIPTSSCADIAP